MRSLLDQMGPVLESPPELTSVLAGCHSLMEVRCGGEPPLRSPRTGFNKADTPIPIPCGYRVVTTVAEYSV